MGKAPLAAVVLLLACAPAAHAQLDSVVGAGGAIAFSAATDPHVTTHPGLGLIGRLRRGTGLGFTIGLGWATSDVRREVDGRDVELGTITARPVMAGVSYTTQFARLALSGALVGGWAFNAVSQTPAQQRTYGEAIGIPDARLSVANGWALRPSATVWFELDNHLGVFASIGYARQQPTVTARGTAGSHTDTINLNATVFTFGVAYGVF